jgi:hypothetical protein
MGSMAKEKVNTAATSTARRTNILAALRAERFRAKSEEQLAGRVEFSTCAKVSHAGIFFFHFCRATQ